MNKIHRRQYLAVILGEVYYIVVPYTYKTTVYPSLIQLYLILRFSFLVCTPIVHFQEI